MRSKNEDLHARAILVYRDKALEITVIGEYCFNKH